MKESDMRSFFEDWGLLMFIIIFVVAVIAITLGEAEYHEIKYQTPECKKDKLVSLNNGVELWVHDHCRDRNERVYYSKKSTSWQSKKCHLVGKVIQCKNIKHQTINGE
jgi:hypothetical protein